MASHGFTVPAGICAHIWPFTLLDGAFPVHHQGAVPLSNAPFLISSGPAAWAAPVRPVVTRAVAAASTRKRGVDRFTAGVPSAATSRPFWERSQNGRTDGSDCVADCQRPNGGALPELPTNP